MFGTSDRKHVKEIAFRFLCDTPNIDETLQAFWDKYEHKVKQWYRDQYQDTDIVISASPEFLLAPIAKRLKIQAVLATRMDKHTGKIKGENCRGEEKLHRLRTYDQKLKISDFYSDSLSDMPLLKLAHKAYVVKGHTVTLLKKEDMAKEAPTTHKETPQTRRELARELFLYAIIEVSTAALDVILFKAFTNIGIPLLVANFMSVSVADWFKLYPKCKVQL